MLRFGVLCIASLSLWHASHNAGQVADVAGGSCESTSIMCVCWYLIGLSVASGPACGRAAPSLHVCTCVGNDLLLVEPAREARECRQGEFWCGVDVSSRVSCIDGWLDPCVSVALWRGIKLLVTMRGIVS